MSSAAEFSWDEMVPLDDLVVSGEVLLGRGNVISKIDIRNNPGPYPIYSSSSKNGGKMGEYGSFMFDEELISWSVDGGGYFFHRPKHKFSVTNVSGYMRLSPEWDYRFTAYSLQFQHEYFSFDYQTKAHPSVIREFYLFPKVPLPEQQKIAAILSSVDDVIEKTRAQIDKLKDLKIGMMQELLTKGIGHSEFKDSPVGQIPTEWNIKTLGEVFALTSGSTPSRGQTSYFSTSANAHPWVKTMDLNGSTVSVTDEKVTDKALNESACKLLPPGTALIAMYGGWNQIGRSGVLGISAATNQAICALVSKGLVDGYYANYWLTAMRPIWKSVAASSRKDPNITKQDVSDFLIAVPPVAEQQRIVERLNTFTDLIENKQVQLANYRDLKKALMQDLLTGKVRVNVDQKESAVA
ncbi:MAG: restriction endonuclease subunit S [Marinobacter sp.]|uniref:restriction endonuclease subunit S n=1 Tax=Marinobacter sp. TaxID=50741 RepID=UPI003F97C453